MEFLSKTESKISNLHKFLESVTPIVPSTPLPEDYMNNSIWKDTSECFTLGDMWNCYDEWGAFGVGTPIDLKDNTTIVQYYVPYLSAVQIYTLQSPTTLGDSANSYSEDRFGYLYFEYSEASSPVWRKPLVDKISQFSKTHPGVMALKSVDLSPASWMAIAWYPIYHIPMIGKTKKTSAYFLTYHTISSFFQENLNNETGEFVPLKMSENGGIPLPPFGMTSYKMENDVWMNKANAQAKFKDFQGAADSWLKQLNFAHHDFKFFTSNIYNLSHIFLY